MKFYILKAIILFISSFGAGSVLFYLHFKHEIEEAFRRKDSLSRSKPQDTESLCGHYSIPFRRFFQQLTSRYDVHECHENASDSDVIFETSIISSGEAIRQYIDNQHNDRVLFKDLDLVKKLMETAFPKFGKHTSLKDFAEMEKEKENILHLQMQTQSEPILSSAVKSNLKSNPPKQNVDLEENFHKFARSKLNMPSAVFVTPYPLHMVYRKLRTSRHHHSELGFCHPIILANNQISNIRISSTNTDRYGSLMDWNYIGSSDYIHNSGNSKEFLEVLFDLINEHITEESWKECFYCPEYQDETFRYISDLPEFQIFILPLFSNPNTKISKFLSEYYKIVLKSSMLSPVKS